MADTVVDETAKMDAAFTGNCLLATFSKQDRNLIEPFGTLVDLAPGDRVLRRGENVQSTLFPIGAATISMIVELSGRRSIEVTSIGSEGAVGGIISCGAAPAFARAEVLIGGSALRVPMQAVEQAKQASPFVSNLFCRYSDYLLSTVMSAVACNAFHAISDRAARWLLQVQDRAGDRIELTQEAFAGLLGVQRTTINAVIRDLSADGLIATGRGTVRVVDRAGLKRRACECYQQLQDHYDAVIGKDGGGA